MSYTTAQYHRTSRYKRSFKRRFLKNNAVLLLLFFTIALSLYFARKNPTPIFDVRASEETSGMAVELAPTATPSPTPSATPTPKPTNKDLIIGQAVDEFIQKPYRSEARMIMHCLAHRESGHGGSNKCGDSGNACGPFQFWEDTWTRMRKQMMKQKKATEIGSRLDFYEAARTTAWALANERGLEWGPILRDAQGSDFATCQKPSWY